MVLGGPLGFSQFVMAVCFARVYFHCHYLFDVLGGMFFGIIVATLMARLGCKEALKHIFYNYLQSLVQDNPEGENYFDYGGSEDM